MATTTADIVQNFMIFGFGLMLTIATWSNQDMRKRLAALEDHVQQTHRR